jgi:sugar phosphate isomerase/epimerase
MTDRLFRISLAQWSLHRMLRGGALDPLDFPRFSFDEFGIEGVEYVSTFYRDHALDYNYLEELRERAEAAGVTELLIMVDHEGDLGDPDPHERLAAVENHHKWVDAAHFLGCHAIRVNAKSAGPADTQRKLAANGLHRLTDYAAEKDIDVLVENHGGLSSNGAWLASVMELVNNPRCGTLPDFGNFCLDWAKRDDPAMWYDRYQGVRELMPFARAVSAKSNDFDDATGEETGTDFHEMLQIVLNGGYRGPDKWVGIEYEGERLTEVEGIRRTKALLERVRDALTPAYA